MSIENTTDLFSDQLISISDDLPSIPRSTSTSIQDTKKEDDFFTSTQDSNSNSETLIEDKVINQTIVNALNTVMAKNNLNSSTNKATTDTSTKVATDTSAKITSTKVATNTNDSQPTKDVRQVNIVISGFNYIINCPANERDELNKAVGYINGFIRELRKNSPALAHENLLVLCCLNLFEEMQQQRSNTASLMETDKQVRSLLEKINNDAQSIMD